MILSILDESREGLRKGLQTVQVVLDQDPINEFEKRLDHKLNVINDDGGHVLYSSIGQDSNFSQLQL